LCIDLSGYVDITAATISIIDHTAIVSSLYESINLVGKMMKNCDTKTVIFLTQSNIVFYINKEEKCNRFSRE